MATLWQMHAPMHVFVSGIVECAGDAGTTDETPFLGKHSGDDERQLAQSDQNWTVPPRHRNRFFIVLVDQVIGVISSENPVVNQRVSFERVTKFPNRAVHEEPMQGPFKKGCKYDTEKESEAGPKKKRHDWQLLYLATLLLHFCSRLRVLISNDLH